MDQKDLILGKSDELYMRYGIRSVSMDDIARELGISKKTLYQYFNNKADLIEQVFELHIEQEKALMAGFRKEAGDAIDEMMRIARHVIQLLRELPPTTVFDLKKYYREVWVKMEALQQRHVYRVIRENLKWGMDQGLYRKDIDPDIVAKIYVGKTSVVADEELFPSSDYNMQDLFREYIMYHVHGIASPKGLQVLEDHLDVSVKPLRSQDS